MSIRHGTPATAAEKTPLLRVSTQKHELFWARTLACVVAVGEGYDLGCLAGVVVIVDDKWDLARWQMAVMAGIGYFSLSFGAPVGATISDIYGRRVAMMIAYCMLVMGAVQMSLASSYQVLLCGRIIQTFGVGGGLCVVTTYLSELAPADARGQFPSLVDVFIGAGVAFGYIGDDAFLGLNNDWRWILGLGAVLPILCISLIGMGLLPESPRYLAMRGDIEEAKEILQRVLSEDESARTLEAWQDGKLEEPASWGEVLCPALARQRHSLCIGMLVLLASSMSGIAVLAAFLSMLLADETSHRTAFNLVIMVAVVRVSVAASSAAWLVDGVGRRPLLIASSFCVAIGYSILAITYALELEAMPWKVLAFTLVGVAYNLGLGPVPFVFVNEIFEGKLRGKSVSICVFISRIYSGVSLIAFPMLLDHVHFTHILLFCMMINLSTCILMYLTVPETAGKSLEELQHVMSVGGGPSQQSAA